MPDTDFIKPPADELRSAIVDALWLLVDDIKSEDAKAVEAKLLANIRPLFERVERERFEWKRSSNLQSATLQEVGDILAGQKNNGYCGSDVVALANGLRDENDKMKVALECGQQNCDDTYNDLRAERNSAREAKDAALAKCSKLLVELGEASGHYSSINAAYQQLADEHGKALAQLAAAEQALVAGAGERERRESMRKGRELPPELKARSDEAVKYANDNHFILSLLYDLDLMPEQIEEGSKYWGDMIGVIAHFKAAIDAARAGKQEKATDGHT